MSGTGGAAAREMPLIHRIFRRQFAELQAMIPDVPGDDAARVTAVADHLEFLLDGLHMHHTTEDDLVWPKLLERVGPDDLEVRRMEEQHRQVDAAAAEVRLATSAWRSTPTRDAALLLSARIATFLEVLQHHLDEEERDVVPLIDQHLTVAEWQDIGQQGFEKFTPAQRWIALGQMVEVASPEEAADMMRTLPLPARVLWRVVGRRTYRRYIAPVRTASSRAPS